MVNATQVISRLFLGQIFFISGITKITAYESTQGYMDIMGVPGGLLPLVILFEIAAGLAIMVGWKTLWVAISLAAFSVLTAVIFHSNFSEQIQTILFMKNIAITGGFLLLAVHGAGSFSLDNNSAASK